MGLNGERRGGQRGRLRRPPRGPWRLQLRLLRSEVVQPNHRLHRFGGARRQRRRRGVGVGDSPRRQPHLSQRERESLLPRSSRRSRSPESSTRSLPSRRLRAPARPVPHEPRRRISVSRRNAARIRPRSIMTGNWASPVWRLRSRRPGAHPDPATSGQRSAAASAPPGASRAPARGAATPAPRTRALMRDWRWRRRDTRTARRPRRARADGAGPKRSFPEVVAVPFTRECSRELKAGASPRREPPRPRVGPRPTEHPLVPSPLLPVRFALEAMVIPLVDAIAQLPLVLVAPLRPPLLVAVGMRDRGAVLAMQVAEPEPRFRAVRVLDRGAVDAAPAPRFRTTPSSRRPA